MCLLSDLERKRLLARSFLDSRTRNTNDLRAKRKLETWLNDIIDAMLIMGRLPARHSKDVVLDGHIFSLLTLIELLMRSREFRPISGNFDDPLNWKIIALKGGAIPLLGEEEWENLNPLERPVEDIDLWRSWNLQYHIDRMHFFHGYDNPVDRFRKFEKMYEDKELRDRLTDGEKAGVERIAQAIENVVKNMV
jgi:hypothetical protein